jgi:AraC-like DNA-binding protein
LITEFDIRPMDYQIFTPSSDLQPFVKCFWSLDDLANGHPIRQRVVPDGCMEMIFHYGDLYRQYFEDGSSILQPRSFLYGQITRFLEIAPTGNSGIISARFFPEGFLPFTDRPIASFEDKATSLEDLFGEKGINLQEQVLLASSNLDRIGLIESFLIDQLKTPNSIDTLTKACVEVILRSRGQIDVTTLADKMNIHRRKMERRFSSVIGMSPKQLARIIRLQSTIKMLEQNSFTNLSTLAYENGYFDQAHFIKDFKEFTGLSPKSFYSDNLRYATLFASAE